VSELEFNDTSQVGEHPSYGEAPQPPKLNMWDRTILPTLSFVIPFILVSKLMEIWFPWHFAIGIGCFVGGLVRFRFCDPRPNLGFSKSVVFYSVVFYLVMSAGIALLAFAVKNLWGVFRR
jgi:hypothetical protein